MKPLLVLDFENVFFSVSFEITRILIFKTFML